MRVKDIIINHTYYFFDDITNIKDFDPNNIKIDERSYKIFLFTILHMWRLKIHSVNPLYIKFNKMNGYFEEMNENKYLTLVPTNENKK